MNENTDSMAVANLYSEPSVDVSPVPDPLVPPEGNRPRFRERLLQSGATTLSDRELLAVLLGSGIKGCPVVQLASRVRHVLETSDEQTTVQKLAAIKGLGDARLAVILAALELGRRYAVPSHECVTTAADVYRLLIRYCSEVQEHFICVMLNGAHEFIEHRVISMGTLTRTLVHPREVFAPAIERRAAAIILCHNHPSGHALPSPQDEILTERIYHVGSLIGIQVLDHVVIAKSGYYSFKEHGLLPSNVRSDASAFAAF